MWDKELIRWTISLVVSALSALGGLLIGSWLASKRDVSKRRYAFLERQLREFYSPLLGLRAEIRMRGELRARIHSAADAEWRRLCAEARETADPVNAFQKLEESKGRQFEGIIEYDNRQLVEELMPAYRRMLSIFRDNLWLADVETRQYFGKFLEFVELWERWLAKSIPHEVIDKLGHSEATLEPFYKHLTEQHDELRRLLSRGKP